MVFRAFRFGLVASAALLAASLPLAAQGTSFGFGSESQDTSQPVEVTADSLSVSQEDGTAIYQGNVIILQGEMRLAAPMVVVHFNEGNTAIDRLEATGGVTLVSGEDAAEAERADYYVEQGNVVMRGNVLLSQGTNAATSEEMTVNLETGQAQLTGRVKTILQPASE